jgi:hypothetical protein
LGFHADMAPKYHPTPVSGSHRKALAKELTRARAMTSILARRAAEKRAAGEAMIREADDLLCQSWNERMWANGEPFDPSPTVDQAINGGGRATTPFKPLGGVTSVNWVDTAYVSW